MDDQSTSVAQLKGMQEGFVAERDWQRFHSPKNLVMALAVEAAELQELYLWVAEGPQQPGRRPPDRARVEEEMADVAICLLNLANVLGVDLSTAIRAKMERNAQKYPASEVRGSAEKYDERRGDPPRG